MLSQAKMLSSNLKGSTAVYISPDNPYWKFLIMVRSLLCQGKPLFMALGKLPLIFGATPGSEINAYSFEYRT